jgi:hypothetical protein
MVIHYGFAKDEDGEVGDDRKGENVNPIHVLERARVVHRILPLVVCIGCVRNPVFNGVIYPLVLLSQTISESSFQSVPGVQYNFSYGITHDDDLVLFQPPL